MRAPVFGGSLTSSDSTWGRPNFSCLCQGPSQTVYTCVKMPAELRGPSSSSSTSLSTSMVRAGQAMTDGRPTEFFWACTLSKAENMVTWSTEDEDEDEDFLNHTLFLRHGILGSGAAEDQRHVVEVETKDQHGQTIKQPLLTLKHGLLEMVALDVNFPNDIPVTLRLIEGTGPVHINGQQLLEFPEDGKLNEDTEAEATATESDIEEAEEEVGEEEDEEEEEEESHEDADTDGSRKSASKATKRKASQSTARRKTKKGRRDASASEEEEEDDEDLGDEEHEESMEAEDEDEEEEDEEEEEKKLPSKKPKAKGKGARVVKKAKEKPVVAKKGKKTKA